MELTQYQRDLVEAHLFLAKTTAYRVYTSRRPGLEMDDVISAGYLGLMKAAQKWDPERGISFGTYAIAVIKNYCFYQMRVYRKYTSKEFIPEPAEIDETGEQNTIFDLIFDENDTTFQRAFLRHEITRRLKMLSGNMKECWRLFYLEEWTIDEIACELKVHVGTINRRLKESRIRLNSVFEGEYSTC